MQQALQSRLLRLLVILAVALLLILHFSIRYFVSTVVETRLEHDAETFITALNIGPDSEWRLDADRLPSIYQRVGSGHYYRLVSDRFSFDSRSLWDEVPDIRIQPPGQKAFDTQTGVSGARLLSLTLGINKSNTNITLWVAEDVSSVYQKQLLLELAVTLLITVLFFLVIMLQRREIKQGFAQLDPIRASIESGDINEGHIFEHKVPQEIEPLVQAIKQLLERSVAQITRSRTSLGNLAHELKRPVQKIKWTAQEAQNPAIANRISEAGDEIEKLMERELRRARIAGTSLPGQRFKPKADLEHLTTLLERIHNERVEIQLELPDGEMPFDRDDMLELLGNLLDNACRFAKHCVKLQINQNQRSPSWFLQIDDDGPGVGQSDIEKLTQRGVRLDEQQSDSGHGLGVSISKAIVDSYSGTLTFDRSDLGGLKIQIELPLG